MKKSFFKFVNFAIVVAFITALPILALAQNGVTHPVEGTYNAAISSKELGTVNFVLVIKKNGDKWAAEIKDSPLPLVPNALAVDAENNISITVDAGGLTAELKGKFDAGKLSGNWTAGEMKGTLEAAKKDDSKPAATVATTATATPAVTAAGSYEGTYDTLVSVEGQGNLPLTLVITKDGDKLKTEVTTTGPLNIIDIKTEGEDVTLVAQYRGQGPIMFPGKRTGDEMGGKWEWGGFSGTWKATKKK